MLCESAQHPPEGPQWRYELKLDGFRAIGRKVGRVAQLARAEAAEVRRINPNISPRNLRPDLWGDQALFARYLSDLREAGLS